MAVKHVGGSQTPGLPPAGNSAQSNGERAVARALMAEIASAPAAPVDDKPASQDSAAITPAPPHDPQAPDAAPSTGHSAGSVDYYAIVCRTIANLTLNNAETRGQVYEHARTFINQRLREIRPALSSRMIASEQIAFDRAVKKIEAEQLVNPTTPHATRVEELAISLAPDIAPPDVLTADTAPVDFPRPETTPANPAEKDRSPTIVVPRRTVRIKRTGLYGSIVRVFAIAAVVVIGLVGYGLTTGKLSLMGIQDAARSAIDKTLDKTLLRTPQQTTAADEQDAPAASVPPLAAATPSSADPSSPYNTPVPDATASDTASNTPEPSSADANRDAATDDEATPYQTQLASFLSLCRPAKTAYGNDPCGNLQPRPFGGLGVTPRKAPEWVAMYDSLSKTIPAVRVKNPKFSAPAPDAPPPNAAAAAPAGTPPARSSNVTAREKVDHGVGLANADNLDGALADFSEAIRLDPKFADAYVQRGQAMFKNGNADRAIADFSQALQIEPRNAAAFKARGMAMLYKGDDDGAIGDLTKAIQYAELDPASIPPVEVFYARRSRAGLYDRKQLYDRELIDLTAMIDSYWKNPGLAATLKTTYRDQGAATLLASIYRLRALANQKRSNLDNAIGDLSFAIQLDPQRALPFIIERARILAAAGRKDQAAADYQQALSISPANTDVKNALERLKAR